MKRVGLPAAVLLSAGALAGCGGGSKTASQPVPTGTAVASAGVGGVQQVTVEGTDQLMFAPMAVRAKVGMLNVTFDNVGSVAHTFRIKGVEPDIANVNGHSSASVTVALTKPGTYYMQCDYHPTMVGTLVVTS